MKDAWQIAHESLLAQRWAEAREALETLLDQGTVWMLCEPATYGAPQHIADRIDAVNKRAAQR